MSQISSESNGGVGGGRRKGTSASKSVVELNRRQKIIANEASEVGLAV